MARGCAIERDLNRHLADWEATEARDLAIESELRRYTEAAYGFLALIEAMSAKERERLDIQLAAFMSASNHDLAGIGRLMERMRQLFEAVIQRDLERESREYDPCRRGF